MPSAVGSYRAGQIPIEVQVKCPRNVAGLVLLIPPVRLHQVKPAVNDEYIGVIQAVSQRRRSYEVRQGHRAGSTHRQEMTPSSPGQT
jgi:hypothetical protein